MSRNELRAALGAVIAVFLSAGVIGQSIPSDAAGGALSGDPRFYAPFSALATLRVTQRTDNGEQLHRTFTTAQFRDSRGRVRIEYVVAAESGGSRDIALVMPNPYAPRDRLFLVDDVEKLIEWVEYPSFQRMFNASNAFSLATGLRRFTMFRVENVHAPESAGTLDNLGNRMIAGVEATGLRFSTHLSGEMDERWESPDLGVVVHARHIDSRTEIEYTLRDIRRAEPDPELFLMPAGYRYKHDGALVWESPLAELRRLGRSN